MMGIKKILTGLALTELALCQSGADILNFVNPLIGTVDGGHVFPGATLPFGMAKAVADVNGEDQGGFASDGSNITGFSHMHDSGTGGVSYNPQTSPFLHKPLPVSFVMTINQNYNSPTSGMRTTLY